MTRKAAIHEVAFTRQDGPAWSHLVVVRWSTRFGRPKRMDDHATGGLLR